MKKLMRKEMIFRYREEAITSLDEAETDKQEGLILTLGGLPGPP